MPTFEEVAGSVDQIMGVKAVWGRSSEPVMCFGSRGDEALKDPGHFQQARATAKKAIPQPYLVTIGGGAEVGAELRGRVLELVRVKPQKTFRLLKKRSGFSISLRKRSIIWRPRNLSRILPPLKISSGS
ncbi:hypothetical protein N2599_12415 [Rhizobium sullae]|uniref:Uncharacterized protein n=1 Tax=Rhizobium sullae TaxID=50338 RepID=A0ABY5XEN3_RHISU|nr:hypothetical protein [Rhizobium sullae]UWU12971.1 hypothetical protein N2599_12415 [Rhizobium sullae]